MLLKFQFSLEMKRRILLQNRNPGENRNNMNYPRESHSDLKTQNEQLARSFHANARYNPLFLIVTGIGFFAIYLLTVLGVFGQPTPQLIYIGILTFLLAALQLPLLSLARRNHGVAANLLETMFIGVFAILLTFFWKGISGIAILIALITPITALRARFPRRYIPALLFIAAASIASILYVNRNSTFSRLQNSTPAAIASFAFLIATALLLITIIVISGNKNFKTLQTLLLTSFIAIVTIPTLMATTLSTIGAYTTSQTQTFSTLKAISNLKESQIKTLIRDFENDTKKLQKDSDFTENTLNVLTATDIDPGLLENSKRVVRSRIDAVIGSEEEQYSEVLILNTQGDVVISTMPEHEGENFENQLFFRQGTLKFYAGFVDISSFSNENLIVAVPIYGKDGRIIRGVVALRSNAGSIKSVMENTPGFENAETYLVDKNFKAVTKTLISTEKVSTQASLQAILNNVNDGQDIYNNYNGERVLGYYKWFNDMQVALISEVPLSYVLNSSVRSLVGSAILALFVIAIAIAAVAISARSIVQPITSLAQITENFAAGKLSARASVDRKDEIGALAKSYNFMATQFQEIIGGLEQRVADRTRELENQTNRLRITAEISRDVASARVLSDLLERSSQLILERFGFDHIAIYLLDRSGEYAILVASPTEAGTEMLATGYQVRVGETSIIGRVSATGDPRVSRNTEADAIFLGNPLLPNTRSEMALPLKTENNVIGVLDIQGNTPGEFSEDDLAIMQILADQLAAAIERTRLLQEVERSLQELETAYGQYTRDNWKNVAENTLKGKIGYRFDNIRIESMTDLSEISKQSLEKGTTITSIENEQYKDKQSTVAVPIKLRGHSIGVITLKLKEGYPEETISTVEQASERLASAFESARLYEEARLRADREQTISQVTSAISSSTSYEEILQTTIREIGTTLRDTEVSIQIISESKDTRQTG
jgi:GAF domain-containing protein/HAMP domain-containing protein